MKDQILEVLSNMDMTDDSQWTSDGFPTVEYVSSKLGKIVKRQEIIDAAPDFIRKEIEEKQPEVEKQVVEEAKVQETLEPSELEKQFLEFVEVDGLSEGYQDWVEERSREEIESISNFIHTQIDKLSEGIEKLKEYQANFKKSVSFNKLLIQNKFPVDSEQDAIRSYLNAQQASRVARHQNSQKVLAKIDLRDIKVASPIDEAMARKTQRGTNRPSR